MQTRHFLAAPLLAAFAVAAAQAAPAVDPCSLLSDAEVRSVFPGAKAGKSERTREKYGIHACEWVLPAGSLALQVWAAKKPGDHDSEIRGLADGFTDPLSGAARKAVRYERVGGVGDGATAVVEARNPQRGILQDMAMLVAQRDKQIVEVQASGLANGDRAAALQALTKLAKAAVGRL